MKRGDYSAYTETFSYPLPACKIRYSLAKPPRKMTEAQIEKKVVKWCRDNGILTYKFVSPAHRGVPDRVMMANSRVMFLELKTERGVVSPLQRHEASRIWEAGVRSNVAFGYQDAIEQLSDFFAEHLASHP
jgi:hypothetical protein